MLKYITIYYMFEITQSFTQPSGVFLAPSFQQWICNFCGNEYFEMKTLSRLEATTEKCSGKYTFLNCREILQIWVIPLKILKGAHIW